MNENLNIAQKCTGCAHLLDNGWTEPRCVDACPTGALKFIEEADAEEIIKEAEVLHPAYEQNPRVYYLNIPKKFIAGTVYNPVAKEVIKGAACTLTSNGSTWTETTDGFGDFWFEGLEVSNYALEIAAEGFPVKTFKDISTTMDVNLGDIAVA
jgi:tetrathionate reductase subunit B